MIVHSRRGIGKGNLRECSVASRPLVTRLAHLALTRPARSRCPALADAVSSSGNSESIAPVCALAIVCCCGRPRGRLRPKLPSGDGRPQGLPVKRMMLGLTVAVLRSAEAGS